MPNADVSFAKTKTMQMDDGKQLKYKNNRDAHDCYWQYRVESYNLIKTDY